MTNLQELQTKVETKIKTLHLAARENQRIIKRDKEKELNNIYNYSKKDLKKFTR